MSIKTKLPMLLLVGLLGGLVAFVLAVRVGWKMLLEQAPMRPTEFGELVQASIEPETLRNWALQQLESEQARSSRSVPRAEIPPALATLGVKGDGIGPFGTIGSIDGHDYVRVYWGYSFGNGYGVLIGRTNLSMPTNRTCIQWVPGIYFIDPQYN